MKYKIVFNPITGDLDYVSTDLGHSVLEDVPVDPSVGVGDWVRMQGAIAVKALADNFSNANVIGICEFKSGVALGNIRVLGITDPIFIGLDETLEYYLSPTVAGAMTTTPPTTPGQVIVKVGQPYSATKFLVLKGIRMIRN